MPLLTGFTGTIYIDPDEATINEMTKKKEEIDKSQWNGIAVYVDHVDGEIHPVTYELIGKARELASKINHPVYALFMGNNISDKAEELLHYGVDKVFVYDFPELARFKIESYTSVFEDFIKKHQPCAILTGATTVGKTVGTKGSCKNEDRINSRLYDS